jgi:transcriptional regulator with XRE-family HTH domain
MPPPEPDPLAGTRHELGRALRELREAAGLSGGRAAAHALTSQPRISRIETGHVLPTVGDVEALLRAYDADGDTAARLLGIARAANREYQSAAADRQRGLDRKQAELAAYEQHARVMRHFLPAVPTGLLHTRAYAAATLADLGTVPAGAFEQVLDAKMARQEALTDPEREWVFLLTETAVRARVAPLEVMAGQCAHMAALAEKGANVRLAVLPFAASWPVMALNTYVVYDERFVTCELFSGAVTLHDPQDVAYHLGLFERFLGRALTGGDAAAFLRSASAEYAAMNDFMRKRA